MADNLSAGIPTYDFATQTQNNSILPVNVPQQESIAIAQDIQQRSSPQKVDLSKPFYGKQSQSLWTPTTDSRPALQKWNTNLDEAYTQLNDGTYVPRFENYMSGVDNENRLAQQQGTGEKWLNGVTKFVSKTGLNVLDATIGTVNGISEGISKGSFNAVYNNDFSKWVDDLNTKLDNNLPNYYSQQEKNASLGSNLVTANFWADKFLGGMSFVIGTVISEGIWAYATGGASLTTAGARGALRGTTSAIRNENRVMHSITNLMNTYQRTVPTSKALSAFNNARFLYTSAGYEAGVEARHFMKEAEANYINHFANEYGRRPSGQELAEFRNNTENGANGVFAANVALVGGSNILMFGDTFGVGSFLSTRNLQRGFNRNLGIGVERTLEGVRDTYRALSPTTTQKVIGNTLNVLKSPFREGVVEEGGQYALANFGQRWLESKYDPNAMQDNFSVIDAMGKSLAETYGTKAGQEEVLLGALIGGAARVRSGFGFRDFQRAVDRQTNLAQLRTANSDFNLLEKFAAATSQKSARAKIEKAGGNGVIANQELNLSLFSKLQVDDLMGLLDNSTENLSASLNELSDQELSQQLNVSLEQAQQAKAEAIEAHTQAVTDYKEAQSIAEALIPNDGQTIDVEGNNSFIPNNALQSVFALNIYMGRNSDRLAKLYSKSISETIGDKGMESAMLLENTLQDKQVNKSREVKKLSRELDAINQATTSRNEELIKIAAQPRTEKGDSRLEAFETRRQQLLAAEERDIARRNEINAELEQIATDVNNVRKARAIANQKFDAVFEQKTITTDDLLKTVESINSLTNTLDAWRRNGQQSAADDVQYLIQEFNKAQSAYRYANEAFNKISNPALRKAEVKNIFGGFLKKAKKQGVDISDYQKAKEELFNILKNQYIEFKALRPSETTTEQTPEETVQTEAGDNLPPIPIQTEEQVQTIREEFEQRRQELINSQLRELNITYDKNGISGEFIEGLIYVADGSESTVYRDSEGNIIKIGEPHQGHTFNTRVAEQLLLNRITNTPLELIGYYYSQNSKGENIKNPVFRQAFAEGSPATEEQVDKYFEEKGFTKTGKYSYENEELNVSDVNEANAIIDSEGNVNIIDAFVEEKTPTIIEQQLPNIEDQLANLEQEEAEALQELQNNQPTPTQGTLRDFYQEIVDKVLTGRRDTDFANNVIKPTEAQIEEYKKLYDRNRKSANGLKVQDQIRFDELKDLLNNYGRALGTVEGGIRLADILEQISSLDQSMQELDDTPTINNTNIELIQAELTKAGSRTEDFNKTQYWEKSEFRVLENGIFSITDINLQGIVEIIGKDNLVQVLYDKTKGQKNNRKVVDKTLTGENYEVGDKFIVQFDDVEIGVTIGAKRSLEISPASATLLNERTRLKLIPSVTLGTNYQPLLVELNRNADVTPMEVNNSNFELEPGLSFTDITNLPDNAEMSLQISLRNPYNQKLIRDYKNGKIKLRELQNNLVIYVMSQEGEVGGVLKSAPTQIKEGSNLENLLQIRNVATQRALNSQLENEIIDTQITVPVNKGDSYFGKPNFNLVLNKPTNTLYTELLAISDKALEKIVDVGYITDGRLTLRENKKEEAKIDTTFVRKISKGRRMPVIVFNYNGSRVAYPVSMKEIPLDKTVEFNEILNSVLPINEKVSSLNQYLAENNIDPNNLQNGFYYISGETNLDDPQHIERVNGMLAAQSTYNDFTQWLNASNIEAAKLMMQEQASINIDITDKPFHSPKLSLRLSERTIIGAVENPINTIVEEIEEITPTAGQMDNSFIELAEETTETPIYNTIQFLSKPVTYVITDQEDDFNTSFSKTWNVAKYNQGTYAHVRILMTEHQKAMQTKSNSQYDAAFHEQLRNLAKSVRTKDNVVLLDIRPATESLPQQVRKEIQDNTCG